METIFLQVLNMSITGSYIIIAVMLLRLLLKKAPKKYSYMLWAVCAFRLCCPVSFQNIASIFNLLKVFGIPSDGGASLEYIPENIGLMQQPQISTGISYADNIVNSSLPAPDPMTLSSINPMQIYIFIYYCLWIAGMSVLLIYSIISCISLHIKLKNSIIYKDNIYQSDKISSPFVFGFINPKIYIPFDINTDMEYILAHERYHIKRRDYIIKPLAFLILTVHWFNPFCWAAFLLMSRDMEMSCDEKVLSGYNSISKEYSAALLSFAAEHRLPVPYPLAFGETGIRGRIKNILKYKNPKTYIKIISALICIAAITACALNPQSGTSNIEMTENDVSQYCNNMIGSIMADIDYADGEKIVFHYLRGLFVYNIKDKKLEKSIDLDKLNTAGHHQGSNGIEVNVDKTGRYVYIINYGPKDEIKDFDDYIIDLNDGSAKKGKLSGKTELFSSYYDTFSQIPNAQGWFSNNCIINSGVTYYLTVRNAFISAIKLIIINQNGETDEQYIFNHADFAPDNIHDLSEVELITDSNYSYRILNKNDLSKIENILSNAKIIKENIGVKPFPLTLKLTKSDGETTVIYLSYDNAYIGTDNDIHYSYSGGDNSELLNLFGVNAKNSVHDTGLYQRTESYLRDEFERVYSPYYDIQSLEISDWKQNGNEAVFFYKMTYLFYNRDPDKAEYIQQAKQQNSKAYQVLYDDYLALKEANYEFKIEITGDEKNPFSSVGVLHLYHNASPVGEEWKAVKIDDFILP